MRLIKFFLLFSLVSNQLAFAYDGDPFGECKTLVITPPSLYEPLSSWFERVKTYHEPGYIPDTYYELFIGCEKSFVQCFYTLDGSSEIQCASTSPGFDNHLKKISTFLSINGVCEKLQIGNAKHAGSSYLLCPYTFKSGLQYKH